MPLIEGFRIQKPGFEGCHPGQAMATAEHQTADVPECGHRKEWLRKKLALRRIRVPGRLHDRRC